jgi:hypothetical protein
MSMKGSLEQMKTGTAPEKPDSDEPEPNRPDM